MSEIVVYHCNMAMKLLNLRCKSKSGLNVLNSLPDDMSVDEFKAMLFSVTEIDPSDLKVLVGFPPKALDLSNGNLTLAQIPLHSGETLIVERNFGVIKKSIPVPDISGTPNNRQTNLPSSSSHSAPRATERQSSLDEVIRDPSNNIPSGILLRKVVPANNSCLFTSVHFTINDGDLDTTAGINLRDVIAAVVAADKETYNEAFLGKPNKDYCHWILNEDHWGGAIELYILSKFYGVEIVAVDTQNICIHRFGEDEDYGQRILLIYDGIHYDPLFLESMDGTGQIRTKFPTSDAHILDKALELAKEAQASRQFTDVASFTLRCIICDKRLQGQVEAQKHAKDTGHINFGEI